ncbi:hypothetical protein [Streptomyces canus]|uniref:hypothetical protein n=1 Tax=Streptomyces canus TaxID=58343 RepID=UPI002E2659E9
MNDLRCPRPNAEGDGPTENVGCIDVTALSVDDLIKAERDVVAAHEAAKGQPYGGEPWKTWLRAAETFQASVTAYAKEEGVDRVTVEMDVKKKVRHPAPPKE